MNKILICILLSCLSISLFSQSEANCIRIINGKEFDNKASISKSDLQNLCTLQVKDARTNKILKPISFKWKISSSGMIFQGDLTTCAKVTELAQRLKKGDIIFIDEMLFKGVAGLCQGQFALVVK
jgi:hypothetical protein